jgi:triacylglycerol esterase/lipase EstA (alpha/beta hydrolase family)
LPELTAFIDGVKAQTGAPKAAIVALSRGGYSTRGYVAANPASVAQAVLGGTPNHGVFAVDALLGSEYNGRGPFLKKLNAGDSEGARRRPAWRARRLAYDAEADGGRGEADHRRVQRGADRRPGLAGQGRPHDDHGAHRLRASPAA